MSSLDLETTEISSHIKANVRRTVDYVTTNGLEAERVSMEFFAYDESFGFLSSSHPYHPYYKRELARSQAEPELGVPPKLGIPNGMTLEKFNTMKLTAQFIAWYGNDFLNELTKRVSVNPKFEFMKPTSNRFNCFSGFVAGYSDLLMPPRDLKEKLRKSAAYMETIVEGFFKRLQWDCNQEQIWKDKGVEAMIDWHASLEKDFANKEDINNL